MRGFLVVTCVLLASFAVDSPLHADAGNLRYLTADEALPQHLVSSPPAHGSQAEALELARIKALIAGTSAERLEQARADGRQEDPTVFSAALGKDIAKLPVTLALLTEIQNETETVIDAAKQSFKQPRPFAIDPSIPHCGKGEGTLTGYPSGHAGLGFAVGWALARLAPDHAPAILDRAADYALSREICGQHLHVDTEASRAIGIFIADRLLTDPRLAARVAAARAELQSH